MGAEAFVVVETGKTAKDAFLNAVAEAKFQHGHGGYTGTIAGKHSFEMYAFEHLRSLVLLQLSVGEYWEKQLDELRDKSLEEEPIKWGLAFVDLTEVADDKWGPAACVEISEGKYLFFGWASS